MSGSGGLADRLVPSLPTLPLTISEADFQRTVIDTALLFGWRCAHFRPARTGSGGWATAMTGHPGYPDLSLARDGVLIVAELKRQHGTVTREQRAWLAALGEHGRLWRPSDFGAIYQELRGNQP